MMFIKKVAILFQQANLSLQQAQPLRLIKLRQQQVLWEGDRRSIVDELVNQLDSRQLPANCAGRIKPNFRLIVGR